jgi:predicted secreted protein
MSTVTTVATGSRSIIRLPTNPSTGYNWVTRVIGPAAAVMIDTGKFVQGSCPENAVGCSGTVTFTLTFQKTGLAKVDFYYVRAYDNLSEPTLRYYYSIR